MSELPAITKDRIAGIDALRGVAVLLMLTQHIIYWMCAEMYTSLPMLVVGAMGGLAMPIFIVLAGLGATLANREHENIDRLLVGRGLMIISFGYLLNLLTPNWFSPGSWYVLHMIGFSMIVAPFLRRVSSPSLQILLIAIMVVTVFIQNYLGTPLVLRNWQMASTHLPGGVLRLVVAEGYFPVFPWIAFFMAGILTGRMLIRGEPDRLWQSASIFLMVSLLLSGVYLSGVELAAHPSWIRVFKPIPNFYPALAPVGFFLIAVTLFFLFIFLSLQKRISSGPIERAVYLLTCLGRCSLSIFMIHVPLIREPVVRLGYWRSLSISETLVITFFLIVLFSLAAWRWRKIQFKYGAEWLLRKTFS